MSTVTDNAPQTTTEPPAGRIEVWEVRDPSGQPHWVELDRGSIDDQLYLIRRLREWGNSGMNPITMIRYHGLKANF